MFRKSFILTFIVMVLTIWVACDTPTTPTTPGGVNSAPVASFYTYDYLVSGSLTTGVNGEYNYESAIVDRPGYSNASNLYLYKISGFNWGLNDDTGDTASGDVFYYASRSITVPHNDTWEISLGFEAITVKTGSPIIGIPVGGGTVTGNYIYSDAEGDTEGISTFQWYLCSTSETGDEGSAITGATSISYTIPAAPTIDTSDGSISKDGMFLKFEVTPVAVSGEVTGISVKSEASLMNFIDE